VSEAVVDEATGCEEWKRASRRAGELARYWRSARDFEMRVSEGM
jgi:hypothetical protein